MYASKVTEPNRGRGPAPRNAPKTPMADNAKR